MAQPRQPKGHRCAPPSSDDLRLKEYELQHKAGGISIVPPNPSCTKAEVSRAVADGCEDGGDAQLVARGIGLVSPELSYTRARAPCAAVDASDNCEDAQLALGPLAQFKVVQSVLDQKALLAMFVSEGERVTEEAVPATFKIHEDDESDSLDVGLAHYYDKDADSNSVEQGDMLGSWWHGEALATTHVPRNADLADELGEDDDFEELLVETSHASFDFGKWLVDEFSSSFVEFGEFWFLGYGDDEEKQFHYRNPNLDGFVPDRDFRQRWFGDPLVEQAMQSQQMRADTNEEAPDHVFVQLRIVVEWLISRSASQTALGNI